MFQPAPALTLPGSEISKKFLNSLNQEVQRLERAKDVASALCPETLSCLCGKGPCWQKGVCDCESVSTKCVDLYMELSHLCLNETHSYGFACKFMSVWIYDMWDCCTDVCTR